MFKKIRSTCFLIFQFFNHIGLHCINKQYIVSGDTYYVPDSKLSASSVYSLILDVIYSRLTNELDRSGSWTAGVRQDDQFIQVNFILLSFFRPCLWRMFESVSKCMFKVEAYILLIYFFGARYWTALQHMTTKSHEQMNTTKMGGAWKFAKICILFNVFIRPMQSCK